MRMAEIWARHFVNLVELIFFNFLIKEILVMNFYDYNNHITRRIYIAIFPNNYIMIVRKCTLLFDEAKGTLLSLALPSSYSSED